MQINETKKGAVILLELDGRLDVTSCPEFESRITALLDGGEHNFILDLTRLHYINSSGLRILLIAAKRSKNSGGKVVIAGLDGNVKEVFTITGFNSLFSLYETTEAALKDF